MTRKNIRRCSAPFALGAILLLAQAASAQDLKWQWNYCNNADGRFPVDVVIRGCTAIIESTATHRRGLTIAYTSRGNAYLRSGVRDRAISDFNRAIELNAEIASNVKHPVDQLARPDADGAMIDLDRFIQLKPQQIASYYLKRSRSLAPAPGSGEEAQKSNAKKSASRR